MRTDFVQAEAAPRHRQTEDETASRGPGFPNWNELVERIKAGDPKGLEELYAIFSRGIRFYLCRQLGAQELDDKVHDTFLIVAQAIQRGELREPERLMGFVRTVVRRQVAAYIDTVVQTRREQMDLDSGVAIADRSEDPEQKAMDTERSLIMLRVLNGMSARDREILTRFYLREQSPEQICREMKLTETQFRLLKSRAKARFAELGRRKLQRKPMACVSLQKSAGCMH
jgi:RNA polymerase sigma factor (sigma-70 family)